MMRFLIILLLVMVTGGLLRAEEEAKKALQPGTVRAVVLAQEQMEKKAYAEAEATLDACRRMFNSTAGYDRAYLRSIYGYLYLEQQRYDAALQAFIEAADAGELSGKAALSILYNIVQLQIMQHRYEAAEKRMRQWMALSKRLRSKDYMLLAHIEIELRRYDDAAEAVHRAIALAPEPKRMQYQTLYYLQYEQHRYGEAAGTLKKMITLFPAQKEDYLQLSGVLLQDDNPDAALAVLELAKLQGFLQTKEELLRLAKLYLYAGIPLRAAKLLAAEANTEQVSADGTWYMLEARAWQQAREEGRALEAFNTAAEKGEKDAYVSMAYLYAEGRNLDGVIDTVEKALASGTDRPDELRLLEGRALFDKGQYLLAKNVFDGVSSKGKHAKEARQWIDYIQNHASK